MGKIIGGLIGLFTLGFFGLLMGLFAGHAWDSRHMAQNFSGFGGRPDPRAQELFFETLFRLMGKLAKADGRVSEAEIKQAEALMAQSGLTAEHRQRAIGLFKQGTEYDFDLRAQMNEFLSACGRNNRLKQTLLVYLISMAHADGELDAAERTVLQEIAGMLGISGVILDQLIGMVGAQAHFRSGGSYSSGSYQSGMGQKPSQSELDFAHKALGVSPDCSDTELKKAYRKLMSENHPDKLMGQGVPEDMIKMANERSSEISKAYDLIREHRKE